MLATDEFEWFRRKALRFLTEHSDRLAVQKLHRHRPITSADLTELQEVLIEAGVGTAGDVARAVEEAGGFGLFIRGLVGLDRAAAKDAFADFLDDKRYTAKPDRVPESDGGGGGEAETGGGGGGDAEASAPATPEAQAEPDY